MDTNKRALQTPLGYRRIGARLRHGDQAGPTGASLVTMALRRRKPDSVCPALPPARPRPCRRRTRADRQVEDRLIVAGLAAGLTPPQLARVLRGSPSWRYRRVRLVHQRLALVLALPACGIYGICGIAARPDRRRSGRAESVLGAMYY